MHENYHVHDLQCHANCFPQDPYSVRTIFFFPIIFFVFDDGIFNMLYYQQNLMLSGKAKVYIDIPQDVKSLQRMKVIDME